jgi:small subunit ribosomal protein S17
MAKKKQIGIVINNKCTKTVTILVQKKYPHLIYKKIITKTKRYLVHDENNLCKIGNIVLIEESIPISKYKKWEIKKILKLY